VVGVLGEADYVVRERDVNFGIQPADPGGELHELQPVPVGEVARELNENAVSLDPVPTVAHGVTDVATHPPVPSPVALSLVLGLEGPHRAVKLIAGPVLV
jgi:hypothetical protein